MVHIFTMESFACLYGHSKCLSLLLAAGADINSCDKDDRTPAHIASMCRRGK